jgi:hypothetical protein
MEGQGTCRITKLLQNRIGEAHQKRLRAPPLRDVAAARMWEGRKVLDIGSTITPSNAKPQ